MSDEAELRARVPEALTKFAALVAHDTADDERAELICSVCNDPPLALLILDLATQSVDRICGLLGAELEVSGEEVFAQLIDGMCQALQ